MNRYQNYGSNNVAGVASTGVSRSQSMTQGAGQAAMVAIQRHKEQQNPQAPRQSGGVTQQTRRANSMTAAPQRSNSMRSYTYHPKPSYTVGQPLGGTHSNQGARRFNSLNSRSSVGSFQRNNNRLGSLTSQNSYVRSRSPPVVYEEDGADEEGDVTVTTNTTKVVDSLGKVLSITVETVKTYADGSTVTNTTTKNISRNNSRANSLNSQSMSLKGNSSGRHSSMLSNGAGAYNLSKIDEDLQDFDYNYELDNDILTQKGHGHPHDIGHIHGAHHDDNFGSHDLQLNHGNYAPPHRDDVYDAYPSPELQANAGGNESINSNGHQKSLASHDSSKPLKSILKKKNNISEKETEDEGFADAVEDLNTDQLKSEKDDNQHPYKSLSSPQVSQTSQFKVPQTQGIHAIQQPHKIVANGKRTHSLVSSPTSRHEDVFSDKSETSNSIKFVEKHETIPIYYDNEKENQPTENKGVSDQEFYNIAMQVAMERVYGKETQPSTKPEGQRTMSMNSNVSPVLGKKPKKNSKEEELNEQGVSDNYVYQNHHKEFVGLSLRDNTDSKQTSRKERAKEEKKQHKVELKEQKQRQKDKEKQDAESSKLSSKEEKKQQKNQKQGRFASFFGRRKSTSNDDNSIFTSEDNKETTDSKVHDSVFDTDKQDVDQSKNGSESKTNVPSLPSPQVTEPKGGSSTMGNRNMSHFNPAHERSLMGSDGYKTRKYLPAETKNLNSDTQISMRNDRDNETQLNSISKNEGTYNGDSDIDNKLPIEESVNNPPSPLASTGNPESYSMRFPRTSNANDETSSEQGLTSEFITQKEFGTLQETPESLDGVDSSVLGAIIKDKSEGGPLFDHDDQALNPTLDPTSVAMNERSSLYSNDAEEKRKGKVLDPITVPVLNDIKSETASLETQSNKFTDIDTDLGAGETDSTDRLIEEEGNKQASQATPDVESTNLNSMLHANQDSKPIIQPTPKNPVPNVDDPVTLDNNDVKRDDDNLAIDSLQNEEQMFEEIENEKKNEVHEPQLHDSHVDESQYGALSKRTPFADYTSSNREDLDTKEAPLNDNLNNSVSGPSQHDVVEQTPIELPDVKNDSNSKSTNNIVAADKYHHDFDKDNNQEVPLNYLPKSSFEHLRREESNPPAVDHDGDVNYNSKSQKKSSKFKQKLFKYFVNSYSN